MKNAYTESTQKVIPSVLLYAFHGEQILMIHARGKDGLPGKWNGLGGKLELGETQRETCVREFSEEASCSSEPSQWHWLGQLYFPNFKAHKNEDWWVNVFFTDLTAEQIACIPLNDQKAREGPLTFIAMDQIPKLDLWDGDRHFLPHVFSRTPFEGTFFYEGGHCVRHELNTIR